MHRSLWVALAAALLLSLPGSAVQVDSPTDQWTAVAYSSAPDWGDDQATGAHEADLVGSALDAALYTFFDGGGTPSTTDGTLGFRLRLGSDDNPAGFKHVAVVGMDVDADLTVDWLIVVDNKGGSPEVAIRPVSGDGSSPAETAIDTNGGVSFVQTGANYAWQAVSVITDPTVSSTDIDGDGSNDYFLSFAVDFAEVTALVGPAFDQYSTVRLFAGTSTNSNSVNQDWAGPNGGAGSTQGWSTLGGFSELRPIPEPKSALLLGLGLALLARRHRC